MKNNNLIKKTRYNSSFFDGSKSMPYNRNGDFWTIINDFCRKYPDVEVTIEFYIRKFSQSTTFYEDVKISCASSGHQEKLNQIYKDYYFLVPLEFYPEFEGRKDILEELLRNDL